MKKTIVTAVIALGLAAFAAADDAVTYTTTTGIDTNANYGNYSSFSFTLSDSLFSGTTTTTNAITTASDGSESYGATTTVYLNSILLVSRDNNGTSSTTVTYAVVTDADGKDVTTGTLSLSASGVANYDVFLYPETAGAFYTRDQYTLTFDGTGALTVGSTYTVTFYNASGDVANLGIRVASSGDSQAITLTSANSYLPGGMVITTSSVSSAAAVPEPATATLSLLALAGLAARRRRK